MSIETDKQISTKRDVVPPNRYPILSGLRRIFQKVPDAMTRLKPRNKNLLSVESVIDIPAILSKISTYEEGFMTGEEL